MAKNLLLEYSEKLACEIAVLCNEHKIDSNTVHQIKKSSSSVFANISEAQYPQSLADMLSKFEIARKECMETESWLKLIFSSGSIDEETFKKYRNLCGRIRRILTSSCMIIEKNEARLKNLAFLVGSGFCPILSRRERRDGARWAPPNGGGHPRAMLAPDASVGSVTNYKGWELHISGKSR